MQSQLVDLIKFYLHPLTSSFKPGLGCYRGDGRTSKRDARIKKHRQEISKMSKRRNRS